MPTLKLDALALSASYLARGCVRLLAERESDGMERRQVGILDRLSVRMCPPGLPIMYQSWGKLLFMHWPVPAEALRPLIPESLAIDTHDGVAWIGLTPLSPCGVSGRYLCRRYRS